MNNCVTIKGNDVTIATGGIMRTGTIKTAVSFNGKGWTYRYGYMEDFSYDVRLIASTRQALMNKIVKHYNR